MRFALVLCLIGSVASAQNLETHIRFPAWHDWPGGLSGLVMTQDGQGMLAVSDDGQLLEVAIARDPQGRIADFGPPQRRPLLPPDGTDWPDTWLYSDSEGLSVMPGGQIVVAYEGLHRLALHDRDGTFRRWYGLPDETARALSINRGFEAVATGHDGRIIAIPEAWGPDPTRAPIMAIAPDTRDWTELAWLPLSDGYAPVGLDQIDGHFYLLERRFHWLWGFSSRLRRFEISQGRVADLVTLVETAPDQFGNLEGLSLWRRADGTLMATALSDNNRTALLPRDLVEWTLPDP